jgi:hypothetical protein
MTELTREEVIRRRMLTEKLKKGTLTYEEALELNKILEKEKKIAEEQRDFLALVAILLLLGMLAAYFSKS